MSLFQNAKISYYSFITKFTFTEGPKNIFLSGPKNRRHGPGSKRNNVIINNDQKENLISIPDVKALHTQGNWRFTCTRKAKQREERD